MMILRLVLCCCRQQARDTVVYVYKIHSTFVQLNINGKGLRQLLIAQQSALATQSRPLLQTSHRLVHTVMNPACSAIS